MEQLGRSGVGRARATLVLALLGAASLLPGCALLVRSPAVEIAGVEVTALGLSGGTAEVTLEVTNRGRSELLVRGFLYELEVRDQGEAGEWVRLAEGFHSRDVRIPGRERREVRVPVPFQYQALGVALRSFLARGEVPYRVRGEVRVGGGRMGLTIPFRSQGTLRP